VELHGPAHVTADYLGEPGQRVFFLQAADAEAEVTLVVEKQQVAALADVLAELLAAIEDRPADEWDVPAMRLREPFDPRWRVGNIAVGMDERDGTFVIEVTEFVPEDDERDGEKVRLWIDRQQARTLAAHASWAVAQGRPACRLCGLPMDPEGHVCPRTNGDARHVV
jgi:uncharacterized repeat protein (TIGR03847 family)